MSSLRPELHVAQQIRRDKLRFQNLQQDFPTNLEDQNMDLVHDVEQPPQQQQSLYSSHYYASSSSSPQQQYMINNNNNYYYYSGNCMVNNFATLSPSVANNHNHIVTVAHYSSSSSSQNSSSNNNAALQDILNHHKPSEMASSLMHHHHPYVIDNSTPTAAAAAAWNHHHQGLSLSLSSSSPLSHHHNQNVKSNPMKPSTSPTSSSYYYRNSVGPLGPFTGYATILKSSRFLKPCQKLLDEYCRRHSAPPCADDDDNDDDQSDHGLLVSEKGGGSSNNNVAAGSSSSSSMFHAPSSSSRPEFQKNKAKLLLMQEEVTRRYKQYHQQMQMVVSAFESVAGLNSATPYVSLALKLVSKNFKSLKNSISDQLKLICQALGEDYSTVPAPASTSTRFDSNMARLQRNKPGGGGGGGGNMDFEPQQHVWRPQRGLPERAVTILKAWLFEHFLHPYPTDTDKHMLATQTGLSRNQVSNWFINARVRVWKPMVEEIHMLETKGANQISSNRMGEGTSASDESSSHVKVLVDQPLNRFAGTHATANAISERQIRCLEMGSSSSSLANAAEENNDLHHHHEEVQWSQEKRSKLECMDGTLMGLMPFRGPGVGAGVGGLGPVSLTLELRHGVEGSQQQIQHHEEQIRHHFGGHMIHDFVG